MSSRHLEWCSKHIPVISSTVEKSVLIDPSISLGVTVDAISLRVTMMGLLLRVIVE